jgi:hypothetical protein
MYRELLLATLTLSISAAPHAVADSFRDGFRDCYRAGTNAQPYNSDYDLGKGAAKILNDRDAMGGILKPPPGESHEMPWATYKKFLIKSKKDFPNAVIRIVLEQTGDKKSAGCMLATLQPLQDEPWSPQHEGFTDHLSPALKKFYYSLPMR